MIGRWYVDNAFVMYSRTHNISIVDGTGFSSYHLGEDISEKFMNKYKKSDWIYNQLVVNATIAKALGGMKTKEVFCQ